MKPIRVMTVFAALAVPVSLYGSGCSSTASTNFGDGGTTSTSSSGSHGSSTSSSGGSSGSSGGSSGSSGGSSGSSGGSSGSSGGSSGSSGGSSGSSGGSSGSGSGSGGHDGGTSACVGAPGDSGTPGDNCRHCCDTAAPVDPQAGVNTGYETFVNALLTCGCGTAAAPGPCATACAATVCAATPQAPDNGCITCLNGPAQVAGDGGPGPCNQAITSACNADTNCVAWEACSAPCGQ